MSDLNPNQKSAVYHQQGPLLVAAGPGSGKTRVIVERFTHLLSDEKLNPGNILVLTFTKKAALEIKERIEEIAGMPSFLTRFFNIGTFHSLFLKMLRNASCKHAIIADDIAKENLVKESVKNSYLKDRYSPEILLNLFSYLNNMGQTADKLIPGNDEEKELKKAFVSYSKKKQKKNLMDFDDILVFTLKLLEFSPGYRKALQAQVKHILLDEYQDINPVQFEAIKLLAAPENNIFAVGDSNQSIYGFRGASVQYIQDFQKHFPGAKIISLETNYRSTGKIIAFANKVLDSKVINKATTEGNCEPILLRARSQEEEAKEIVNIIASGKQSLSDYAILTRTVEYSRVVFEELAVKNIPFISYHGRCLFYQKPYLAPVLDCLKLANNPLSLTAAKSLITGEKLFLAAKKLKNKHPDIPVLELLLMLPDLPPDRAESFKAKVELVKEVAELEPQKAISLIRKRCYDDYLLGIYGPLTPQFEIITEKLNELEHSATRFRKIADFLIFIDTMIRRNYQMSKKNGFGESVSLMTMHAAKGLEFKTVFVIGAVENHIPHRNALEETIKPFDSRDKRSVTAEAILEEARLFYVACTRAKQELYISSPQSVVGKDAKVSRFVASN